MMCLESETVSAATSGIEKLLLVKNAEVVKFNDEHDTPLAIHRFNSTAYRRLGICARIDQTPMSSSLLGNMMNLIAFTW